ncbi:MAG: hypothetical protein HKP10_06280, partial [Kiritimatiellales bacterium]|nr:hypothetical protein [Kiritimatiellales bacterium]
MKKMYLLLMVLMCFVGANSFADKAPQWVMDLHEPHVYQNMNYRLLRPIDFDPGRQYPVIVSLHGASGTGDNNISNVRHWNSILSEEHNRRGYPCYVIAPQSNGLWKENHFLKVQDIINTLPNVDISRRYLMGHSMGGHGAIVFAKLDPSYFAAVFASAGSNVINNPTPLKELPIWLFHGLTDGVINPQKSINSYDNMVAEGGGHLKLTLWERTGHGNSHMMV